MSRSIVGLVDLVPSCLRRYVWLQNVFSGISWAQNIFSWVFRGFKIYSRGYFVSCEYFVCPKFFLVGISQVRNFFAWVFREYKVFSREYLMGPKFFLVGSKFFLVGNFVIFSSWPDEKKRERNIFRTAYSFLNRFQQL